MEQGGPTLRSRVSIFHESRRSRYRTASTGRSRMNLAMASSFCGGGQGTARAGLE